MSTLKPQHVTEQSTLDSSQRPTRCPSAYEMRPLRTDDERAKASALVENRLRWLAVRGLPVPSQVDIPALYRDTRYEAAGLFEDEVLLACLTLDRQPHLEHWGTDGTGPALFLGHVHTLPARPDNVVRLITLWASDYAARLGLPCLRAEAVARHGLSVDPIARFLDQLKGMGWSVRGAGKGAGGEWVARLELPADSRPGLAALIGCAVPLPREPVRSSSRRSRS
ncbi:hypothetical protein ACFYRD_05115 [Streptomyces hirsutus]|uniref:hypothetical protein n=1 Tax=Streptomyces hirsutus TaxID=35620 RepID=UPI00367B00E9